MQFIEQNCTFTHNGKPYSSGGAFIVNNIALVYIIGNRKDGITATDWHGNLISSRIYILREWKQKGSTMRAVKVCIDNEWWHGRYGSDWSQACRLRKDTNKRRK